MNKRKIVSCIVSLVVSFVFLLGGILVPFVMPKDGLMSVKAEGTNDFLYAFVAEQTNRVSDGKIYVDVGMSVDFNGDGDVTRFDAEEMALDGNAPFTSAKLYFRTRDMSAIAAKGDYEAVYQEVTVFSYSPYTTIAITVNPSGLKIGDVNRQFIAEIYKVEVAGVQDGCMLVQPYATPNLSSKTLNAKEEIAVGALVQNYDGYTLLETNMQPARTWLNGGYAYDVSNTSLTGFYGGAYDLDWTHTQESGHYVVDNWWSLIQYMSANDMLKLGVRLQGEAIQDSIFDWISTDNSFVGIQIFGSSSTEMYGGFDKFSLPALPGVPEEYTTISDPSTTELARWYIKFQSDNKEGLELANSYNGEYVGITAESYFDETVYLPQEMAVKDYGQGGVYDSNVAHAEVNTLIIDDLDKALNGGSYLGLRIWGYDTDITKDWAGDFFLVPMNYRAELQSATLGTMYKDKDGKERIGLSLRFNEPVQFKQKHDNSEVLPYIDGYINGNTYNSVRFEYESGEGTDTLFLSADVSNYTMNITRLRLNVAHGFEDVYDFAPDSVHTGLERYPYEDDSGTKHVGKTQELNVMEDGRDDLKGVINGWDNVASENITCAYDMRTPILEVNGKVSEMVKTSHSITVRTTNVSEGNLYYGWVMDDVSIPSTLAKSPISAQGFQAISSPSNLSGARYLYVVATSSQERSSDPIWVGPFHFDNDAPTFDVKCLNDTYQTKDFEITISNKSNSIPYFNEFADLKKSLQVTVSSDSGGKDVIKTFFVPIAEQFVAQERVTLKFRLRTGALAPGESTTLAVDSYQGGLGLEIGSDVEFGNYYVSFSVGDVLENYGESIPTIHYFDVREIFGVQPFMPDGASDYAMDEFLQGGALYNQLNANYYTLDLSKRPANGDFLLNFKVQGLDVDDSTYSLKLDEFVNVASGDSVLSSVRDDSNNCWGKIVIKEDFNSGLYRVQFRDLKSSKKSLPMYFYVTAGREGGTYQDESPVGHTAYENIALANRVFQIPVSVPYHYLTDIGELRTVSYTDSGKPLSFSSWTSALQYVLYREYSDLYAFRLSQAFASDLNSNIRRKASGVNVVAQEGQIWIRYKDANWQPNSTTSAWVYYYYGDSRSSSAININALSIELNTALNTVANMICSYGEEVDLVTAQALDEYGAPTLAADQIRVNPESMKTSSSGTQFEVAAEYYGDTLLYLSLDPDAPLATNALVESGANKHIYYKTEATAYRPLVMDNRKTFGQYFGATGKFTVLELDEYGAREYCLYIDRSAPTLTISWKTKDGTQAKTFSSDDSGQTISGSNFYVEGMDDYDPYSFIAIYKYTGQGEGDLLSVYRKNDFDQGIGINMADGNYHVHVSDRSGNDYAFVLQVKSESLVCSIKEVMNSYIQFSVNRSETEIRYQVYFNNRLITTYFSENRFTQSGEYHFHVEDIYGNVYDETYVFERELPAVEWRYQTSESRFETYEKDNELIKIRQVDEVNYVISTSTYLRFLLSQGCKYEVLSGSPTFSENVNSGWVTLNQIASFKIKIYYEQHPESYVIYTCTVDNSAPKVSVSYEKNEYVGYELEELVQIFQNGNVFELGRNEFIPSFIGFHADSNRATTLYVSHGERVQAKYFKVQVSDESGVKEVKVYVDGELILTKKSDFSNIYVSRRGSYEIVATDNFGNSSSFYFVNEFYERVEYLVDGESHATDIPFTDYFKIESQMGEKSYTKVEYGNSQTEIKVSSDAELHYIITDESGKQYYFAFSIEDGSVYTFRYVVEIVKNEVSEEIENICLRGANPLATGEIAKIDGLGVAIYLSKNNDGTYSFAVRSVDECKKTYTVETRVTAVENESPYYFKTMISNVASVVEFTKASGEEINATEMITLNEGFTIQGEFGEEVERVEVAYSQTGDYELYQTVYDGVYHGGTFSAEGMYHVKVVNRYGIQTEYHVVLSARFVATATVEYKDGTILNYSTDYTSGENAFYSNHSVEFIVYSTSINFVDKPEAVSVSLSEYGYTVVYIDQPGEYLLTMEDEYQNVLVTRVVISSSTLTLDDGILTGFNKNALRLDENYTNQKVLINKDAVLSGGVIAYLGILYGGETLVVYDTLSENAVAFDEDQWVGLLGDGEYTLVFRDCYGNKVETTVHYCGTPTLSISRKTLNSLVAEHYSIEGITENGVWTNDSVTFSVSATEYILKVDDMQNVFTIRYDSKTKSEYEVYYLDEYGFEYTFTVYLRREQVVLEPTENTFVSFISDSLVTKDGVTMKFTDGATCTYSLNGDTEKIYEEGDVLYKDGVYRFKAVDKAGNIATYTVKKDSAVEYRLEGAGVNEILLNGGVTNGTSVRFFAENSDSAYLKKVFHNNVLIEYEDNIFTERGKWELIVADDVGNESYFRFYILYGKLSGFSYYTPYNYQIKSVILEVGASSAVATETIQEEGLRLNATENGTYTVTMQSTVTGDEKTFSFTIDKTPPQVELNGCAEGEKTINNISLKGCSVGDTIYVYRDGSLVKTVRIDTASTDFPEISESGKYKLIVENEAGITTEFTFERKYVPNAAGSILIIVLSLAAATCLLIGLIWRNHSKTDD